MTDGQIPKSVLARGALLLRVCAEADVALSLAELALRTGLPKPTAHRLVGELVRLGLVERTAEGGYRIGLGLFVLGQSAPTVRELRDAALPYLGDLHEATHENVHLAVPDGTDTLFLEKVTGHRATPIVSRTGGRLPAHCTATGKVFLAEDPSPPRRTLPRLTPRTLVLPGQLARDLALTRARGYGVNLEEAEVGVSAVAAPIYARDHGPRPIAAISVTGGTRRLDVDRVGARVCAAARALTRKLSA
ncbi:IclR family transcriptional regulator [Streptomyces cylindrosporus]|uniref:IclR family transcriptional regulator n=1 Tax=Streptomyces cylindrosporus TaxID=2927583 RepID=A0ABS9Y0U5_9ACTN|nr:IclR family transcriptional regulator [Streptomyces cylindrosporus]MCI3270844.1 IclR family transcriptional regulator [Streptomyces cylindrosporus]